MLSRPLVYLGVLLFCLQTCAQAMGEAPAVEVTTSKQGDSAKVTPGDAKATVVITSRSGIGRATVRRTTDKWPTKIVVQLRLRGLEMFSVTDGKVKLATSVLSHSGHMRLLHVWKDGKEGPQLKKSSPYWTDIRSLDDEGRSVKGLPPDGGYFEMALPNALFKDNPESLSLRWIDFYR